ncbi:MAG: hypothetical protein ABSD79_03385 [Dehalococcoidales bacterium]|jgi:hypothetical protein
MDISLTRDEFVQRLGDRAQLFVVALREDMLKIFPSDKPLNLWLVLRLNKGKLNTILA